MGNYRCRFLSSDYIGVDSAAVCRQHIAQKAGYVCPRKYEPWIVHISCFDLRRLLQKQPIEVVKELVNIPRHACPSGDGKPDLIRKILAEPNPSTITEVFNHE